MSTQRRIEDYEKVLAVEGYSDLLFFAEVLEHLGKLDEVFTKHFNGASDLVVKLETFLDPGLLAAKRAIGIIVDADRDASGRIQSISDTLQRAAGRTVQHNQWDSGQPNLGFLVLPDGKQPGEIETLVWESWCNDPQNTACRQCIDEYLACMQTHGCVAKSLDKGRISALLAVRNDEDPRLGPGARARVFAFDRPELVPLLEFLRHL